MKPRCSCGHLYKEHFAIMFELEAGRVWSNRTGHCWIRDCPCDAWQKPVVQREAA